MRDIYSEAQSIIIWLGTAEPSDEEAFKELEAYDHHQLPRRRWRPWEPWYRLFRKQYWTRIWIIQEIVVAKEAHIWCGTTRANAEEFLRRGLGEDGVHELRGAPG